MTQLHRTAYVYHQNGTAVYKLKKDFPLFRGDTLITNNDSRVILEMADESTLALAGLTKLTIDKALPTMKVRNTVLQLFLWQGLSRG